MKIKHFKTSTTTTSVEIEVPDGSTDKEIDYHGNVHRMLHGVTVVEGKEETWYVKEDEAEGPKSINPHSM